MRFPFFGIQSSVSGVGYNVAKALTVLGDDVRLLSLIGGDMAGRLVLDSLADDGISAERVITALRQTPQSVILYDRYGSARHQHGLERHSGCGLSGGPV